MLNHPKKQIPLADLKAQFVSIESDLRHAIERVLQSQQFVFGPEVEGFEREVAEYCDVRHGIGVSSGTDALLISLMAHDVGPGDEVITTTCSFFATAEAISRVGAKPVFVDIEPGTSNINPDAAVAAITGRTKAIMPVHLFGQSADMAPILCAAQKHGIPVIEDAAEAIGAEYQGTRVGGLGTTGCLSFFPSKNLGVYGDGGMVLTNDDALADKLRILRNHGAQPKNYNKYIGGNFRLDAIQASIGRAKLPYLDGWIARRQENAARYTQRFTDANIPKDNLRLPRVTQTRHVFHLYVIETSLRDALHERLKENGIGSAIYWPLPFHLQECYAEYGGKVGDFPVVEKQAAENLAIPVYPEMGLEDVDYVADIVIDFFNKAA